MAKKSNKAKPAAKADTSTHKPGETTDLTISEWYAECRNDSSITGKAHKGLANMAVRKGFITLKAPAK